MNRILVVMAVRGRPRHKFLDQSEQVEEYGQVKSTRNRQACMRNSIEAEEAIGVCKDRSKWKEDLCLPHWETVVILCMCLYEIHRENL
jgi:hypothetical protein